MTGKVGLLHCVQFFLPVKASSSRSVSEGEKSGQLEEAGRFSFETSTTAPDMPSS